HYAETFAPIFVGLHPLAPLTVFDVPAHRACDTAFKIHRRLPAQLAANLRGVNRVAPVVARTIRDEPLQLAITPLALRSERRVVCRRQQLVERVTDRVNHLRAGALAGAADVVLVAAAPVPERQQDAGA